VAAKFNHGDVVEILLTAGADVNARDRAGRTALRWALSWGDQATMVERLLRAGAEVDARDAEGETPLISAAILGRERCARVLLTARADPEATAHEGSVAGATPLMLAASFGHPGVVGALLAAAANVRARDPEGRTARLLAELGRQDLEVIRLLEAAGAPL
jgi:ankyrin repeat protein